MATLALARVYRHSFRTYPNWTLAITGGCLSAAGDVVGQLTQNAVSLFRVSFMPSINQLFAQIGGKDLEDRQPFDVARMTRFFCYGLAMSAL